LLRRTQEFLLRRAKKFPKLFFRAVAHAFHQAWGLLIRVSGVLTRPQGGGFSSAPYALDDAAAFYADGALRDRWLRIALRSSLQTPADQRENNRDRCCLLHEFPTARDLYYDDRIRNWFRDRSFEFRLDR
jgi:hypothetical protein